MSRTFPTDPTGLPVVSEPALVRLGDGAAYDLEVSPVAKRLGTTMVRMLAYNGSVPGPTLAVDQGSTVTVTTTNHGCVHGGGVRRAW